MSEDRELSPAEREAMEAQARRWEMVGADIVVLETWRAAIAYAEQQHQASSDDATSDLKGAGLAPLPTR